MALISYIFIIYVKKNFQTMSSATDTLKIKNLPKELSEAQKENFARHFGATRVRVITSRAKEKAVVYAKFETIDIAKNVLHRIHQIKVLNVRLCVEYADDNILQGKPMLKTVDSSYTPDSKFFKSFLNKVTAFNDNVGFSQPPPAHLKYNYPNANRATINNIAHALMTIPRFYTQVLHLMNKMNLPPPFALPESAPKAGQRPLSAIPPPPQKPVVTPSLQPTQNHQISVSPTTLMITSQPVQKQVSPVQKKLPDIVVPRIQKTVELPQVPATVCEIPKDIHDEIKQIGLGQVEAVVAVPDAPNISALPPVLPKTGEKRRISSSESEIESDEEAKKFKEIIPEKRHKVEKKMPKRPKFILPPVQHKNEDEKIEIRTPAKVQEKVEEVFEKVEVQQAPKKIELKVTTESLGTPQESPQGEQLEVNVVAIIESSSPLQDEDENDEDDDDALPCITLEELKSNQITDFKDLPLFQNYDPGQPTNKVYIKNCSKTVTSEDLEYIYNRYREEGTEQKPSEFNIRLMKEGRMKGQAFVTLDTVEMAEKAVKETHGFILKDKPLFVAFGKAGTKKK